MIKYIEKLIIISSVFICCGCKHRMLHDEFPDRAIIPISVHWDMADITPQNVTALIYKEDGSFYLEWSFENSGESAHTYIPFEVGNYTVVFINEKLNQIDYIRIRGYENLHTLEAYITTATSIYETQGKSQGDHLINQPGPLATAIRHISVTPDMVLLSHTDQETRDNNTLLKNIYPTLKTVSITVKAHISGLNNARMPALSELRNIAESYFFAIDRNGGNSATMQFLMNNKKYKDGSLQDGTIAASVNSFGVIENNTPTMLNILFQLVDKERTVKELSADITSIMRKIISNKNILSIDIDLSMGTLPDVKPDGSSESGLSSNVIDWDKIEVPIKL